MSNSYLHPSIDDLIQHSAWLKRLAHSLVKDPTLADDLVQETWVSALESPPQKPGNHRNWLGRVLRNRVASYFRSDTRRMTREQRQVALVEQQEAGKETFAEQALEMGEMGQILADSVMELKEPFRTTMLMHFLQEMSPSQISKRMDVPVGTVRTRILRGLTKLKVIVNQRYGGEWKRCHSALAVFAGVGGKTFWLSARFMSAAAILAVTTLSLLVLQPWKNPDSTFANEASIDTTTIASSEGANPVDLDFTPSLDRSPTPIETSAIGSNAPGLDEIVIQGRCVDSLTGNPLPDIQVRFIGRMRNSDGIGNSDAGDWNNPPAQTTEADGKFEFRFSEVTKTADYELVISHPHRVMRKGDWSYYTNPIESINLGDIQLATGSVLSGTVTSTDGLALPKVSLKIGLPISAALFPGTSRGFDIHARTDEQGTFLFPSALPAGRRALELRKKGYLQDDLFHITINDQVESEINLHMKTMPFISGRVQYADGTATHKARVRVEDQRSGAMSSASTDVDGNFKIYCAQEPLPGPFALQIGHNGQGAFQEFNSQTDFHWGDQNIILTVEPALHIDIVVVDAGSGNAIESYGVVCEPYQLGGEMFLISSPDVEFHANGELRISGLNEGPHSLQIFPQDPKYKGMKPITLTPSLGGSARVPVELEAREQLEIYITSVDGKPIENSMVRIFAPSLNSQPQSVAQTDVNGLASLYFPPQENEIRITVNGQHGTHRQTVPNPLPGSNRIDIEVATMAEFSGLLRCNEAYHGEAALMFELTNPQYRSSTGSRSQRTVLPAESGTFTHSLLPGRYNVFLQVPNKYWTSGSQQWTKWVQIQPALAEVTVAAGLHFELDATHVKPCTLNGRLLLEGVPIANKNFRLFVQPLDDSIDSRTVIAGLFTDENGAFTLPDLVPGRYQLMFRGGKGVNQWPTELGSPYIAVVEPGVETIHDFNFLVRILKLRPLHPDTADPMPQTQWSIKNKDPKYTTDSDGWLTIECCPLEEFQLVRALESSLMVLGPLQIDPLQHDQEIEMQASSIILDF
jgi:RNA polymerase sigma factor (sigma-70 family)